MVEEEEDGVIYTVVVKQQHGGPSSPMVSHVRLTRRARKGLLCAVTLTSFLVRRRPLFLPVVLQSPVSRSQCLKAGTEEKLVLHLLHSFSLGDSSFITIFLSTYRSFTSTKRVLDILTDR